MIHKGQRIHVLYLDSLNNIYPDLDNDLQHFWTRAAHVAQQLKKKENKTKEKKRKERRKEKEKRNLSKKRKRHINNNTLVKHWFSLSFYCLVLQCNLVLFPEMSASQPFRTYSGYCYNQELSELVCKPWR